MSDNAMFSTTRRGFVRAGVGAATLAASSCSPQAEQAAAPEPRSPDIKISLQVSSNLTDEELAFPKQMGIDYVSFGLRGATLEQLIEHKQRVEAAGLKVANIGNSSVHNMPEVTLNLPGRDEKIEEYKQYLRNLGQAGIGYTTYAHMGNGIWSSDAEMTRGGAASRAFHLDTAAGSWAGERFEKPLSHGREYTQDELWENYTHFIKQVAPVAEEEGVRIGIHPDDPPVLKLAGVPRGIFGTFDGYVRAFEIADSPNVGICLCCGCWLEGGEGMGKNTVEAIHEFAGMGKLWKIHLRNVTGPVPDFVETFIDDGYGDTKAIIRALVDVNYDGILIADHVPQMVGGRNAGWAYSMGYIKALYDMARDERAA